jgi:diadenosine tetraphosphate (Ap4A) HIT family hydrolase
MGQGVERAPWKNKGKRQKIEELRKKYPQICFRIFHNQKEANKFIEEVKEIIIMPFKRFKTEKLNGYNIGTNCGEVAGQSVMHLHVHSIPRYQGDMEDTKGGGVIPSKQKY